ncbi:MAG: hypothetical protein WD060_10305, partial [Pirellulales bacterium]
THDNHVGNVVLYQLSYTRGRHAMDAENNRKNRQTRIQRKPRDYRGRACRRKVTLWAIRDFCAAPEREIGATRKQGKLCFSRCRTNFGRRTGSATLG